MPANHSITNVLSPKLCEHRNGCSSIDANILRASFVSVQFHIMYIDDVLSINNPEFENYLGQMYPVEFEIKDTTESNTSASYLDLLLSIGRDNFTLPFMTNVTTSISTSQIFCSWVAIFQPRPPMASLFRSLYGMPGLAPRMDDLSWGYATFK